MKSSKKRNFGTGEYRKERGAVTIFLVIVLVPCIVLSSISVDLSRVQLSKSVAVSAADLSLNTLLTNYDGDLSEWYGMIGSCQEIDKYYSTATGYFTRALTSKGMSDGEFLLLSDVISSRFGGGEIHDLVQVDVVDNVQIEEVKCANLANPTLIKDQIVEFMKYRAPVELTKGIIERLLKEGDEQTGSLKSATEAEKNEPMVEAKKDFYETEGELLKGAYRSYLAIMKYKKNVKLTNEKLIEYAGIINGCRDTYQPVHDIAVSNLLNTQDLTYTYYRKTTNIGNYYGYHLPSMSHVYSRSETIEGTEEEVYYISNGRMSNLVGDAERAIRNFDEAKAAYESSVAPIMSTPPGTNDVNEIQWWVRMHKAVYVSKGNLHSKLSSAADSMMEYIRTLSAALECLPDPNSSPTSDTYSRCSSAIGQIESRYYSYLSGSASSSDPYVNAANTLAQVSKNNIKNVKSNLVTVSVNGSSMTVDNAIKTTAESLSSIYEELVAARDLLNVAIDGDGKKTPSLKSLADLAEKYGKGLTNYQKEVNDSETDLGKTEKKEIADLKEEGKINENITRKAVEDLEKRLTNIRSQLNQMIKAIENLKYGGTSLKDIKTFATFREAALTQIDANSIPLKNAELNSLKSSSFDKLFKPVSGLAVDLKNTSGNSHNPQLNLAPDEDPAQTETPELLKYMDERFENAEEDKVNEREKEQDEAKKAGEDEKKNVQDKGRYHGGGGSVKRTHSSGSPASFASGAWGSLVELIEILGDPSKIAHIRDDIYVTSYIMEMFSFATFEEEGMYQLIDKKTSLTLPSGGGHTPEEYKNVLGAADSEKTWLSENMKDTYNKTLTNKMINKTNNVAYGAEVEYILKGSTDNVSNVKAVYKDIYGIRYVLNLVSGFQHFWGFANNTSRILNDIANAISVATMGIIPAPVTKVIVIPILTIFETGKDLDRLEAGFPVELYKVECTDWWIRLPEAGDLDGGEDYSGDSISGFLEAIKTGKRTNKDKGIFYSDYLTMFVYFGLKSGAKTNMYLRTVEVIETNLGKATGTSYNLEKTRMYFRLKSTLRVKPMMVALPYYFDEYDNLMMTTTDWCTYNVNVVRGYS